MHENTLAALRCAAEKKHHMRLEKEKFLLVAGRKDVGKISRRDLFILGLALYWGEGYKGLSDELGFTNSDPAMILFFIRWLSKVYKIKPNQLILRVSINASHTHRVRQVEYYWSRLTGIQLSQFTMTSLIKTAHKKVYANKNTHYGTLRIRSE